MGICSAKDDSDEATTEPKEKLIKSEEQTNTVADTSKPVAGGSETSNTVIAARELILKKFPSNVEIRSQKDSATTGNFEITVNGTLIHSKATMDHGFLHTNKSQQDAVFAAITEQLEGTA